MTNPLLTYKRQSGLTQKELSELIGVSQPHISQLLSGKSKPTFELIRVIRDKTDGAVHPAAWFEAAQ